MTTREMVNMYTENGTKRYAQVRFSGWTHSATEVMQILTEQGYHYTIDCCTYRHHAIIVGTKE